MACEQVRSRFDIRSIRGLSQAEVHTGSGLPDVPTWKLVEALSLLSVVLHSQRAFAPRIDLFGKTGPIDLMEDGVLRYLWAQPLLRGEHSHLGGRPDLILTSSREPPTPQNAIRILEAKCVRVLGTPDIRSEFGKAHDLRVSSYLIWSFYSPSDRVVAGARRLGIDLEPLGFDTDSRSTFLRDPEALIGRIANTQAQSRRASRFAAALVVAGEQARNKLLRGPT
jgi:hypothetical protein